MTRPLNFLHLTTFYPPYSFGGDAMYIYRLAHALGDQGHHVDVVHDVDAYHLLHPAEPSIRFAANPNVTTYSLRSNHHLLSPLLTQQTGRAYLKAVAIQTILDSKPYDVIHYHNVSLLGPEVMLMKSARGTPIKLYTTHEHWLICPTHVLWKFNREPCDKPECFRCTLMAKRPPQWWRYNGVLDKASAEVDQFVSPSRFTAEMHASRGFPRPVGHLPYFIERADDDWQHPRPRPQERPYFLFVGRLEFIKGVQTLIQLWQKITEYDLLIAGAGNYEAELRNLAADNPHIRFLGPQPQHELGVLYHHALASIVPSLCYETFGMVLIESLARRTPVIVRDLGALPEVVRDSKGGMIYRSDDELLSSMGQLASTPRLRAEMGTRGYEAFLRNWSRDAHMEMYFNLLESVASKKYGRVPWSDPERDAVVPQPSHRFPAPMPA